jgi:hypothetical protein
MASEDQQQVQEATKARVDEIRNELSAVAFEETRFAQYDPNDQRQQILIAAKAAATPGTLRLRVEILSCWDRLDLRPAVEVAIGLFGEPSARAIVGTGEGWSDSLRGRLEEQRSRILQAPEFAFSRLRDGGPARPAQDAHDFEAVCAEFMQTAGFPDARRTVRGPDGGVDVVSARAVGQAKFHGSRQVTADAIRALYGSKCERGVEFGLFFAYGPGFTADALATAERLNVVCYVYNAGRARFVRVSRGSPTGAEVAAVAKRSVRM